MSSPEERSHKTHSNPNSRTQTLIATPTYNLLGQNPHPTRHLLLKFNNYQSRALKGLQPPLANPKTLCYHTSLLQQKVMDATHINITQCPTNQAQTENQLIINSEPMPTLTAPACYPYLSLPLPIPHQKPPCNIAKQCETHLAAVPSCLQFNTYSIH